VENNSIQPARGSRGQPSPEQLRRKLLFRVSRRGIESQQASPTRETNGNKLKQLRGQNQNWACLQLESRTVILEINETNIMIRNLS
jgi:hypothetical protein